MRHRAPTPLARLISAVPRRGGLAAGAVAVLGATAGVGLYVVDGPGSSDQGRITAGSPEGERAGTSYPDAAALESLSARSPSTSRGQARTSPSAKVSEAPSASPDDGLARSSSPSSAPTTGTPETNGPGGSSRPSSSGGAGSASSPSGSTPSSGSSSPSDSGSSTAPPPSDYTTPEEGPETTAVTDLAAAGTWTIVLSSAEAAGFECSLDGAAFAPCGRVATYTGLSNGWHTFAARAIDDAGTADPTPAQLSAQLNGPPL